ncbi:MAG TPA: hypothetical protein VF528_04405 [Pyrinomonadaceae bacterium]|jgi:hypothetical protein
MKIYKATTFCKRLTCPSSETLLSYGAAGLASELKIHVTAHIAGCDFCGAELQLLTSHPPATVKRYEQAKMPAPLHYLAESLLKAGSLLRMESFAEIADDKERLTLMQ